MPKSRRKVRISFSGDSLTHFGGLFLLQMFFQRLGLRYELTRLHRRRERNSRYTIGELALALIYPVLLGLGRIETTKLLQQNGVFQDLTGLRTYPDPTTLRRFLTRLGTYGMVAFHRLHDRIRTQAVKSKSIRFDLDTTVLTVYGNQEKAKIGHNPKKRGRPSFQPLFCFEGNSGVCWEAEWLPGDAHPVPHAISILARSLNKLQAANRKVSVRADAAFYDQKFLDFIEEKQAFYAIVAKMFTPLKNRLGALRYRRYHSGLEAASFMYQPESWNKARRFVIIRRPIPEEPSWQMSLFKMKGFTYQVIVTNLDLLPINVWKFYNGRSTAELVIRELKYGCAIGSIPRKDWVANLAYFHIVLFSYNLLIWFKQLYLPKDFQRLNIQTLRHRLFWVPALLIRPQGIPTLKLPKSYPYQNQFLTTLHNIERRRVTF